MSTFVVHLATCRDLNHVIQRRQNRHIATGLGSNFWEVMMVCPYLAGLFVHRDGGWDRVILVRVTGLELEGLPAKV